MLSGEGNWTALRAAIKSERRKRGLTYQEAANAARISRQTWHKVENGPGVNFQDYILGRVEAALGWTVGAIDTILASRGDGLDSTEAEMRAIAENPDRSDRLRRQAIAVLDLIETVRAADADERTRSA